MPVSWPLGLMSLQLRSPVTYVSFVGRSGERGAR